MTTYYTSTVGNDSNPGTKAKPFRTIQHGVDQLATGDRLLVRGGVYRETVVVTHQPTQPRTRIIIANYPGEKPVIDRSIPALAAANNGQWKLIDSRRQIWETKEVVASGTGVIQAYMGPENGDWRLAPYDPRYNGLTTDNEVYVEDGNYYAGTGLWKKNGKLQMRLQYGKEQPEEYQFPRQRDPNDFPIWAFDEAKAGFQIAANSSFVDIDGIDVLYCKIAVALGSGANEVTVKNLRMRCAYDSVQLHKDGNCHNVHVSHVVGEQNIPPWISWDDCKTTGPFISLTGAAVRSKMSEWCTVRHSRFFNYFDVFTLPNKNTNWVIQWNLSVGTRDDWLQLGNNSYEIEASYNIIVGDKGPGWNGKDGPPKEFRGTKYFHHNIVDCTPLSFKAREGSPYEGVGPKKDGWASGRPFGEHNKKGTPDPWMCYYNTCLMNYPRGDQGMGFNYRSGDGDPNVPMQVLNNILCRVGEGPEDAGPANTRIQRKEDPRAGKSFWDGNLYWRPAGGTRMFDDMPKTGESEADLAAFRSSDMGQQSGWEVNGVEGDPELTYDYRPAGDGPAATGAIDLTDKGWPGTEEYQPWRGALFPTKV